MGGTGEVRVSEICTNSDIDFEFPKGLSLFEPYLQYWIKEILQIGDEAYVSRTSEGAISGIFLYDDFEKTGAIYTRSREVFDYFYELKPFDFLFSEMKTEHESEVHDIYSVELHNRAIVHSFNHEISLSNAQLIGEIERFMALSHPGINRKWVNVALKNGEMCFIVRLNNEIAGVGWASVVNRIGRLHSLYVKPQFRRIGIAEDILFARLLWLKSMGAHSAFSEISRNNVPSSKVAMKGEMKVSGQIFQYFRKNVDRKTQLKKKQMR